MEILDLKFDLGQINAWWNTELLGTDVYMLKFGVHNKKLLKQNCTKFIEQHIGHK